VIYEMDAIISIHVPERQLILNRAYGMSVIEKFADFFNSLWNEGYWKKKTHTTYSARGTKISPESI